MPYEQLLQTNGLTELIASGRLTLEADLVLAAKCKTLCEEDDRNDQTTINKWRQNAMASADQKVKTAQRAVDVKANNMCQDATTAASKVSTWYEGRILSTGL
jgi:hypothetical protein